METMIIEGRSYIPAQEAAYRLQKSISSVFKATKNGLFGFRKVHALLVDEAEFEAWSRLQATKKQNAN